MATIEPIGLVDSDAGTVEVALRVDGHRMGRLFGSLIDLQQFCETAEPARLDAMELAIVQWHALDPQFGKQAVEGRQMKIATTTLAELVKVETKVVETKEASEIEVKP
jgi:hypothetical protein